MKVLYAVIGLVLVIGLIGCIPPKEVYPTIVPESVYENVTSNSVGAIPSSQVPLQPLPLTDGITTPSAPNPYLNQTLYLPMSSYFKSMAEDACSTATYWNFGSGNWYSYSTPTVPSVVVFWTGTAIITVQ